MQLHQQLWREQGVLRRGLKDDTVLAALGSSGRSVQRSRHVREQIAACFQCSLCKGKAGPV